MAPVEPRTEPVTELQHAAARAWTLMIAPHQNSGREPALPYAIALDMVQDAGGGERAEAVAALVGAAADWLVGHMPRPLAHEEATANRSAALVVCDRIRAQQYESAELARRELGKRVIDVRVGRILRPRFVSQTLADDAARWGSWCARAHLVLVFACGAAGVPVPDPAATGSLLED